MKKKLFYQLLRIRMVEEEIAARYPQGKMRCPTHLSIGQEAVAVGVSAHLTSADLAVSTHRAHAHYLAKGGDLNALIAELHGKVTGCTQGRGGSMNLSDLNAGFVASTAIVGNTIPIGVGLAFSQKLRHSNNMTVTYIGDAAIEEGVFYESLNFAVLRQLPILFICENNLYSVNTPLHLRQPAGRKIYEMARAIGANALTVDGNDVFAVYDAIKDIVRETKINAAPWFIELPTYRYKVHCGPEDDIDFQSRPEAELKFWLAQDPVKRCQAQLVSDDMLSDEDITAMRAQIADEINAAFEFAEQSAFPDAKQAFDYRYAETDFSALKRKLKAMEVEEIEV